MRAAQTLATRARCGVVWDAADLQVNFAPNAMFKLIKAVRLASPKANKPALRDWKRSGDSVVAQCGSAAVRRCGDRRVS